jgi:hypothetical protein
MRKYLWIFSLGGLVFEGGQSSCAEPSIVAPIKLTPHPATSVLPRHTIFTNPPTICTKRGAPVKRDGFNMLFEQFNCAEECRVNIVAPPICENFNYLNIEELHPKMSDTEVSLGGYLFQVNNEQPCSLKGMECCYSCSSYLAMVDFKDKENWFDCRRVELPVDMTATAQIFSMDATKSCCVLDNFNIKAMVRGKINVKDAHWSFSEVSSICRLP